MKFIEYMRIVIIMVAVFDLALIIYLMNQPNALEYCFSYRNLSGNNIRECSHNRTYLEEKYSAYLPKNMSMFYLNETIDPNLP